MAPLDRGADATPEDQQRIDQILWRKVLLYTITNKGTYSMHLKFQSQLFMGCPMKQFNGIYSSLVFTNGLHFCGWCLIRICYL
ncbi:hypothetical protein ACSBR1_030365 [Camellia fascicularis]